MKRKFGVFISCFFLSFCIACGNTNSKVENDSNIITGTEYIEESNINYTAETKTNEVSSSELNEGLNENSSSQQESDIALKEENLENELDPYVGEYNAYDIDEPMLQIRKNDDGSYLIQIGIYRLTQLDKCVGIEVGDRIEFSTTEWGEANEITGTITVDDDIATVVLLAEWSDTWFKDVDEYKYYKTSNIPNIYGE